MQQAREVELGKVPTEAQLAKWYEEHNITPAADGTFTELPYGPPPVEKKAIVEHVRANAKRHDVPNMQPSIFNPKTMVFLAGGPSLAEHLDEVRAKCLDERYDVYTSNATCKYLLSRGIKPKYHIIIDPKESKVKDLDYDCPEITLILGMQCHPSVFDAAKGRKAFKFLAASATDQTPSDVDEARAACTTQDPNLLAIGGGSMMGTRAVYMAEALGYRRLEYYGFDASVKYRDGRVNCYAYTKNRGENILEVEAANGRKFYSTMTFERQATEMTELMGLTPGLEIVVHGDSFMANHVAMYKAMKVNKPYRISPEYKAMQRQMHQTKEKYGTSGSEHAPRVFMAGAQIVRKYGKCDILDYGCGKETLRLAVEECFPAIQGMSIVGYDPGRPGFDAEPQRAQVVVCTDVMEHVEPECVDAVIRHIADLAEHVAIIDVALTPAVKTLPDGRNAHISLHSADWWMSFFKKYFVILEQQSTQASLLIVGQPIQKWLERMQLKKPA